MPLTSQHIKGERPMRQRRLNEGVVIQEEDIQRSCVLMGIRSVCEKVQIPGEKRSLQALQKLYLSTRVGIESNIALLVEQAMEWMMEQEQFSIVGKKQSREKHVLWI